MYPEGVFSKEMFLKGEFFRGQFFLEFVSPEVAKGQPHIIKASAAELKRKK